MSRSRWAAAYHGQRRAVSARLEGLVRVLVDGVAASLAGYAAASLLGVVVQTITVRQLGPARYGDYVLLLTSLGLIGSALGLGLDSWLLKSGGTNPERLPHDVYQVLLLKSIGAAVLVAILALGWSSHIVYTPAFLVGVAGTVLSSFAQTGYAALRATRHNRRVALFQSLEPALVLVALLAISAADQSVLLLVIVRAVCAALLFAVLMRGVWRLVGQTRAAFDPLPVIRGAWLFATGDMLAYVYGIAPIWILGSFLDAETVGLFRPAVDLITLTFTFPTLIFLVALPLLSSPDIGRHEFTRLLRLMSVVSALYGIASAIGLWWLGERLLGGLYGPQFRGAHAFVQTMSLVPLLKAGSFICAAIMVSRNTIHLRVAAQGVVAVASIAASFALVPALGAGGVAWVIVGLETLLFCLYLLGAIRTLRSHTP